MKLFSCDHCNSPLYFENDRCATCGLATGFHSGEIRMVTLHPDEQHEGSFRNITRRDDKLVYCANRQSVNCNWLVPADRNEPYCISCQLNKIIPNLSVPENRSRWQKLEVAKKRLVYSLLKLKLPFKPNLQFQDPGLRFEFLSSDLSDKPVMTGHLNGLITINIEEADEIQRHINQLKLGEKYRTILGHFRHEVGHYYWNRLVRDGGYVNQFRALFGNEEIDYAQALTEYYRSGAPWDWQETFISAYASSHPWEDWAETWANYLHIMDSLETAFSFGLQMRTISGSEPIGDPYTIEDFQRIINTWLPLSNAMNNLNRSMGHEDFYAFYISPRAIEKLAFIHRLYRTWSQQYI